MNIENKLLAVAISLSLMWMEILRSSGAGKSTLLRSLNVLVGGCSGSIQSKGHCCCLRLDQHLIRG